MIQDDLRLLCQFAFTLSRDLELAQFEAQQMNATGQKTHISSQGDQGSNRVMRGVDGDDSGITDEASDGDVLGAVGAAEEAIRGQVQRMLVQYSLFSWEIN